MNAMIFDELMFRLAIEQDLTSSDVRGRMRAMSRDEPGLADLMKPVLQRQATGQIVNVSLEDRVDNMRKVWDEARPVERGAIRLNALEQGLRGRLAEALLGLELDQPGDIRDALKQAQALQQNPHPGALREALDFLAEAKVDAAHLAPLLAELNYLYPPDPEDTPDVATPA